MVKNINIVVAGLGTVGTATVKLLEKNKRIFLHKFGLRIAMKIYWISMTANEEQ